jgi:hypothetical protein
MKNLFMDGLDSLGKSNDKKEESPEVENKVPESTEEEQVLSNNENIDTVVDESTTVENTPSEFNDETALKFISEKLGREVSSFEDLVQEKEVIKEIEKPTEYLTEFGKGYEEFFKETGRSPDEYMSLNKDVSSMSQEDVIKESLRIGNPELSKEDIDFLYEEEYITDEEVMDDREIRKVEIKRKKAHQDGVKELNELKKKFLIPKETSIASKEAKQKELQAAAEESARLWSEEVSKTNKELSSIEIDFGENHKFNHSIPQESKESIKDVASDNTLNKFLKRYAKDDGTYDSKKFQQDLYVIENLPRIINDVREQQNALTTESLERRDKNIDFKSGAKPSVKPNISKEAEQEIGIFQRLKRK